MRSLKLFPPKWLPVPPSILRWTKCPVSRPPKLYAEAGRRRKCAKNKRLERFCDSTKSQNALPLWLLPVILTVSVISGCNQNSPPAQPQSAPAAASAPATPPPASAPQAPAIPPGTELPVLSVDSVMLNRTADSPGALIIDVTGTIPAGGWTNPHLVEDTTATADPSVRVYKFVATSPGQPPADQMPQMAEAELRIDSLPAEVKTVRVVAAGNQISAPVTE